jgi:peptide chain release factor
MTWLQISSGQGPGECAWVVARLSEYLCRLAAKQGLKADLLESEPGEAAQTLKSALLSFEGQGAEAFVQAWQGTVQWIGQSPYRPHHRRKNWFVGVERFEQAAETSWNPAEFRFETTRSGGPGGQNVNKVETAVRITHLPTGLSVLSNQERTQWRNRQLGLARLIERIEKQGLEAREQVRSERWQAHHELERGNAGHIFRGPDFRPEFQLS